MLRVRPPTLKFAVCILFLREGGIAFGMACPNLVGEEDSM